MNFKIIVLLILVLILFSISVQAVVPGRTYIGTNNNYFRYIIKPGDTFYSISRIFKTDLKKLMGLNYKLNPNALRVGDQVIVSINKALDYYVIKPGNTLWGIRKARDYSLNDIIAYNRIENPSYIISGEVIFLPEIYAQSRNIKIMEFEKKHGVIYVSGVARVFEATLNYALETKAGNVIKEGFTTALMGAPEWGRFDIKIAGIPERAHYLTVYSISARDGSRQDEVKLKL